MIHLAVPLAAALWCGLAEEAPPTPPAAPLSALARMPVKELTVFKDGHAFVLHEGRMPTDPAGNVLMDYLPTPVIGTFWPYAADKNAKLTAVTAGSRRVLVERTALTLRDLVEANPGAEVIVTEINTPPYPATVVGFLTRSAAELEATAPPSTGHQLPQKSNLLMLKTAEGTKVVNFERVQDVKFLGKFKTTLAAEEFRNLLTMKLDWAGGQPAKTAEVGMVYLQKGVRWIPSYRVELGAGGKATVKLEATILNELTDLDDVTLNLVVGVPTFAFKDTVDPIALGQTVGQLSPYFDRASQTAHAFSNSLMTQTARMSEVRQVPAGAPPADLGPDVANTGKSEDLFIYTVKHVRLKKGQRQVLPVTQSVIDYKDVFVLDVPFAPPPEMRGTKGDAQAAEINKLFHAAKVMHKVRLVNQSGQPLTTAPALIVRDHRVLAQGMMTYTAAAASTDLTVTTAVDIQVKKTDKETKRTPNAATWQGHPFWRIDLAGSIRLTNHRNQPTEIEVVRHVLGNLGEADHDAKVQMVNVFEDDDSGSRPYPPWWGYYGWADWWYHFNGIGRITWQVKLEPGAAVDLNYTWHYYWR